MDRRAELLEEKEMLEKAYRNILEGGQEFQTRDGRVKQAGLGEILSRLNAVNAELYEIDAINGVGGRTRVIKMKYKGHGI